MCSPAPAARAALDEATRRWPGRSRVWDGICASPEHTKRNPNSSHETGDAWDLTHDPAHGVDCRQLSRQVIRDPRTRYVIFAGEEWSQTRPWWKPTSSYSQHEEHMHVDLVRALRNDVAPWFGTPGPSAPAQLTAPETGGQAAQGGTSVLAEGSTWVRVLGVLVAVVFLVTGLAFVIGDQAGPVVARVAPLPVPKP